MNEEVLLSCQCHGYHYVEFWYDKDFGLSVVFIERPRMLRDKLKAIWNAIRSRDICSGEIIIKSEDYQKLSKYLKKSI